MESPQYQRLSLLVICDGGVDDNDGDDVLDENNHSNLNVRLAL